MYFQFRPLLNAASSQAATIHSIDVPSAISEVILSETLCVRLPAQSSYARSARAVAAAAGSV